jgi:hypothetical protein
LCLDAQEHVKQERRLMAECDCVFLVRLVGGFQDAAYLYMVLEAAMGGEFFLYMQVRTHVDIPCWDNFFAHHRHHRHTCDGHQRQQCYEL